jgi:hypothetical protein
MRQEEKSRIEYLDSIKDETKRRDQDTALYCENPPRRKHNNSYPMVDTLLNSNQLPQSSLNCYRVYEKYKAGQLRSTKVSNQSPYCLNQVSNKTDDRTFIYRFPRNIKTITYSCCKNVFSSSCDASPSMSSIHTTSSCSTNKTKTSNQNTDSRLSNSFPS